MLRILKNSLALVAFATVACGTVNEECRETIFADTVSGLLVGAIHGCLKVYCIYEASGRTINYTRVRQIMRYTLRTDTVVGLLIGVIVALHDMLLA